MLVGGSGSGEALPCAPQPWQLEGFYSATLLPLSDKTQVMGSLGGGGMGPLVGHLLCAT